MKKKVKVNKFRAVSNDVLIQLFKNKVLNESLFEEYSEYEIKEEILKRMYQFEDE